VALLLILPRPKTCAPCPWAASLALALPTAFVGRACLYFLWKILSTSIYNMFSVALCAALTTLEFSAGPALSWDWEAGRTLASWQAYPGASKHLTCACLSISWALSWAPGTLCVALWARPGQKLLLEALRCINNLTFVAIPASTRDLPPVGGGGTGCTQDKRRTQAGALLDLLSNYGRSRNRTCRPPWEACSMGHCWAPQASCFDSSLWNSLCMAETLAWLHPVKGFRAAPLLNHRTFFS
jgi:hypothetical protein